MSVYSYLEPLDKSDEKSTDSPARDKPRKLKWVTPKPRPVCESEEVTMVPVQFDLHFVGETGTARPDGESRSLIRTQARRRGKRLCRSDRFPTRTELVDIRSKAEDHATSPCDSHQDFPTGSTFSSPCYLKSRSERSSLSQSVSSDTFDPFDTLPISGKIGNTPKLIRHYHQVFLSTQASQTLKDEVLGYAMSDPALLHSVLAHAALHSSQNAILDIGRAAPDLLYHRGRAIRLLNERIEDPNLQAALNTTFCAVACMTHLEIVTGTRESVRIHIKGLGALVQSRGGIEALACYPLTMGFTIWTDTIASIVMDAEPCLSISILSPPQPQIDYSTPTPLAPRYLAKFQNLTSIPSLASETTDLYRTLVHLTARKESLSTQTPTTSPSLIPETITVLHQTARLERRLLTLARSDLLAPPNARTIIYKLFANSALIHDILFIRQAPTRLALCNILSFRLQRLFLTLEPPYLTTACPLQRQYPELILWAFMIGGFGGVGTENSAWFARMVAEVGSSQGIRGRLEIREVLGEWLWSEQYLGSWTAGFWDEVAAAQGRIGLEGIKTSETGRCYRL